jgi:plastocyanin
MIVSNSAYAFPLQDYAWSKEQWVEASKDVRTSYNPNGHLNPDELTLTVEDERFVDFIYWVWNNKIDEHQVEMIGGSEWNGPTNGVIFHWAPGSRWETHTVMPFDMAIGHVTGEHQWFDTQFPDFFKQYGGTKEVNIKERLSVEESPTWGEFVNFIGDPNGRYYRYLYHQEMGIDPEKKLVYMTGGNGVAFVYTFQRYLEELKEVLTDASAYQFYQMYDLFGKGFASTFGWAGNPVPNTSELAVTGNSGSAVDEEVIEIIPGENEVIVKIEEFSFPEEIKVKPGTKVTWVNMDLVGHTVTEGLSSKIAEDRLFDVSGEKDGKFILLQQGDTFSYTFEQEGTYMYRCIPHPYMTGKIVVEE